MAKWKCDQCGNVHRRNPKQCRSCGHTVLSPVSDEEPDDRDTIKIAAVAIAVVLLAIVVVLLVV